MKQTTRLQLLLAGCIFLSGCSSVGCSSIEVLPGYCLTSTDSGKSTTQDSALPRQNWAQEYNGQNAYVAGHNQDEEASENADQQMDDKMSTEYQSQINDSR